MSTPHPRLAPLLKAQELDWDTFSKRGRPPLGVRDKRAAIVTTLHESGCTWAEMIEITGLSNGSIQRLTGAMWNDASRKNRQESAARMGRSRAGEKKPWLSKRLREDWASGKFYSLLESPKSKFGKCGGRGIWCEVVALKCSNRKGKFRVRSTYERQALVLLYADPSVVSYQYEPPLVLKDGARIYPDFVVTLSHNVVKLIEVKPQWVLDHPTYGNNNKQITRLKVAADQAKQRGWHFCVWTEEDLGL